MTEENPIIAEVRRVRHEIAAACGNDLRKILAHANEAARRLQLATQPVHA